MSISIVVFSVVTSFLCVVWCEPLFSLVSIVPFLEYFALLEFGDICYAITSDRSEDAAYRAAGWLMGSF